METTLSPIRVRLREAREEKGWTQVQLAEKAGVRQASISAIEGDKMKRIDLDILERLCRALGLEPGDLLELEDKKRKAR